MSKKSTARTGSEGDADSSFDEVFATVRSGSSSCRSKRELEGPFGDSPCEKTQKFYKDYFLLMFQGDDTNTDPSESSEVDQELYNLQNDYLEKLNTVRRKLNLIELTDETESTSISPNSYKGCTITEVIEEKSERENNEKQNEKQNEFRGTETGKYELVTVYPSPVSYSIDYVSDTSIFDLEYNPPKKKMCYRKNTPKLTSVSEGNLPYYTRVSLHDSLFNPGVNVENEELMGEVQVNKTFDYKRAQCLDENLESLKLERNIFDNKFSKTVATQYAEDDFRIPKPKPVEHAVLFTEIRDADLFPEVIIKDKTENVSQTSSCSSLTSKKSKVISDCSKVVDKELTETAKLSLNTADNSDESVTTTTYSTIIDSPKSTYKDVKKRFGKRNRVSSSEKLTMWEEIRKLYSSKGSNEEKRTEGEKNDIYDALPIENGRVKVNLNADFHRRTNNNNEYIRQYLRYKREVEQIRTGKVPFGTKVVDRGAKLEQSPYLSRSVSSSASNDNQSKESEKQNCWQKACFWCWPKK